MPSSAQNSASSVRRFFGLAGLVAVGFLAGYLVGNSSAPQQGNRATRSEGRPQARPPIKEPPADRAPSLPDATTTIPEPPSAEATPSAGSRTDPDRLRLQLRAMLDAKASKSDLALINHASSSGDPRVRALGLAFELATSERGSAVAIAFEELADGGSPQEVLVAARYLGRQSDDAIQRKLKEQEASAGHGAKWPLAVALAESGSVGALRAWGEHGAKEVAFGGRNARRILRLAGLYPHDDVMGIAVAASRSADVVLRRAAVRVLGAGSTQAARDALHALRQDADEGVRTAAIDAVRRQSGKADSGGAER